MIEVGVVAALAAEARTLGPGVRRPDGLSRLADGSLLALSGMGCIRADAAAQCLVEAGASALMSFGMAGGLDPALIAGSVVLPREVIAGDGARFPTSAQWRESLAAAVGPQRRVSDGALLSRQQAIDTAADKAAAFRDTGAVAVDMESLAVARVAADRRVPFIAVRVIVDTAADVLPPTVLAASLEGQVRIWRLIGGVVLAPAELIGVIRLTRRYAAAMRTLAAVAGASRLCALGLDVRAA